MCSLRGYEVVQVIDVVLIEYPDRLVRFGFGYLEQAFGWKDVRLEVLTWAEFQTVETAEHPSPLPD